MKAVLLSIQPKWCELIANGKKTIEVRKTKPKLETPFKVYIYCTKPRHYYKISKHLLISDESLFLVNGKVKMCDGFGVEYEDREYKHLNCKVIGEFVCDQIDEIGYSPEMHGKYISDIDDIHYVSCVDFEEMFNYLADGYGYAWHISDLVIYDKPKELSEFSRPCDGNCQECEYALWQTYTFISESKIVGCMQKVKAPQSWCYVEERSAEK